VVETANAAIGGERKLALFAALEAELAAERTKNAALASERDELASERDELATKHGELATKYDRLLGSYEAIAEQLELLRRRLFAAKAERIDTTQLELEFGAKLAELDALNRERGIEPSMPAQPAGPEASAAGGDGAGKRPKPRGRRNLADSALPVDRIELADPAVASEPIDWEVSYRLMWKRGHLVRVEVARAKYRVDDEPGPASDAAPNEDMAPDAPADMTSDVATGPVYTTPLPAEILPRSIATPSLLARIVSDKFCDGLPLNRQEDRFRRRGEALDRGTMSRWLEELGGITGATVVEAMRRDAMANAFCISTDASGVLVQPGRHGTKQRRGCRRAHFFVQIADADHVFFEYKPRETSEAVSEMFRGFGGYVVADAKSVFDILFRLPNVRARADTDEPERTPCREVGCWSHNRRKWWEAAIISKDPIAREGLLRIKRIFDLDRTWKHKPPDEIRALRELHVRHHVEAFFAWVEVEYQRVKDTRGLLPTALGYAHRQQQALMRFLEDGRLPLTNNESERELRRIAGGRAAWLFVGSDDHGEASANLLTLVASAKLHGLDPEAYLRDLFRVLPHWPRDRYLELCPRDWRHTRAGLDPTQLDAELGPLTVPPAAP
jgi:hypothetical protein